jgi:hypothetical protein
MGNGCGILSQEIARNIKELESDEARQKCSLGHVVPSALIRALRVAEGGYRVSKRNTYLLLLLLVVSVKYEGQGILEFVISLLLKN